MLLLSFLIEVFCVRWEAFETLASLSHEIPPAHQPRLLIMLVVKSFVDSLVNRSKPSFVHPAPVEKHHLLSILTTYRPCRIVSETLYSFTFCHLFSVTASFERGLN